MKKIRVLLFAIFALTSTAFGDTERKSKKLKTGHSITNKQIQKFGAAVSSAASFCCVRDEGRDVLRLDPAAFLFWTSLAPSLANLYFSPDNKLARRSSVAKTFMVLWTLRRARAYSQDKKKSLLFFALTLAEATGMYCTLGNKHATKTANKFPQRFRKKRTEKKE